MTPLELELDNLRQRTRQQIRMDVDEVRQAKLIIRRCKDRIERNEQLLKELRLHDSEIHEGRTVSSDCACDQSEERCTYCY